MTMEKISEDLVEVFDSLSWSKTGDVGNNAVYWKRAMIVAEYWKDGDLLVDVIFEGDPERRVSHGHFKAGIRR